LCNHIYLTWQGFIDGWKILEIEIKGLLSPLGLMAKYANEVSDEK